jgi:hypothetical protein
LVYPIFLHINKIAIYVRQKKEKKILWGKAPYGCLLIRKPSPPYGMDKQFKKGDQLNS